MKNQNYALGMIETIGYPALVAAADAASKAADVKVVTYQGADAGLVTVYIVGDVASVQASVSIGAEEAKRVGRLHHSHVIARPDDNTKKMIFQIMDEAKVQDSKKKTDIEEKQIEIAKSVKEPKWNPQDLSKASLQELRQMANSEADFPLPVGKINAAKKEELIKHLTATLAGKGGDK